MTKEERQIYASLVLAVAVAADFHAPTVAGVLAVTPRAVTKRLNDKHTKPLFVRARAAWRVREHRARSLRTWWRERLRNVGVEPSALPLSDPLWSACYRFPRGEAVRRVAAELRRERPGQSLATPEALRELLRRVLALANEPPTALASLIDP